MLKGGKGKGGTYRLTPQGEERAARAIRTMLGEN